MPQHWSKDYVEHIRSVHFALAGLSLALIIVVLTSKPYDPVAALREVDQILKLKKDWSPVWLRKNGAAVQTEIDNTSGEVPKTDLGRFLDEGEGTAANEKQFFDFVDIFSPKKSLNTCTFLLPRENWYGTTSDWSPTTFPETLADFKNWWDELPFVVYFPGTYSTEGWVQGGEKKIGRISPVYRGAEDAVRKASSLGTHELELEVDLESRSFSYVYVDTHLNIFVIPIFKMDKEEVSRASLAAKFGWKNASYEMAFPDLTLSAKGYETLDLDRTRQILSDDAAKGSQILEAFGIKFPAEQINVWGILLVLSVQLYLFSYLKQLAGKLKAEDAGWDVPWIGTNDTALAKIIFFVTLVVMPSVALAVLGRFSFVHSFKQQGGSDLVHALHSSNAILSAILWVAVLVVSLYVAIRSWHYRPLAMRQDKSSPIVEQPILPA
jgi:hypothetical protein